MFASDDRIVTVRHYEAGWVSNSYRYGCPRKGTTYTMTEGVIVASPLKYDGKRSGGNGPEFVGSSVKGGTLATA